MSLQEVVRRKSTKELKEILPKARNSKDDRLVNCVVEELERRGLKVKNTRSKDGE